MKKDYCITGALILRSLEDAFSALEAEGRE
jgi:hypothetical protein